MKRKFLPQKITFADVCEDESSAYKARKIETNSKATSTTTTEKVVFKPFRMVINPADLIDTPPLRKPGKKINKVYGAIKKDSTRKTIVPARLSCSQANGVSASNVVKAKKKATKIVRKELFNGSQNCTSSLLHQIPVIQTALTTKYTKLDNTQPLINVNDIEAEVFQSSHAFKQRFENNVPLKQRFQFTTHLPVASARKEVTISKNTTGAVRKQREVSSPLIAIDHCLDTSESLNEPNLTAANTFNKSGVSPEENEFIANEIRCKGANYNNGSLELLPYAGNNNQESLNKKINTILHNNEERIKNIQQKCTNLQQKVQTFWNGFQEEFELFQGEIQDCQDCHAQDMKKIRKLLENETDKGWNVSAEVTENIPYSESTATVKKSVTFNLKSGDTMVSLEDNALEKSVNLYNSLRKGYKQFLTTPKLNRTSLQTPKRLGSNQSDSVSRKVQKQCLLLLDTPGNENRK